MSRSRLPGASRGLGYAKPHVEFRRGTWSAFSIAKLESGYWKGYDAIEHVGVSPVSWLQALRYWKASVLAKSVT